MIIGYLIAGFFSAMGWWGANHFVIDPYFPTNKKQTEEKNDKESSSTKTN
jgi:hypothetical protein